MRHAAMKTVRGFAGMRVERKVGFIEITAMRVRCLRRPGFCRRCIRILCCQPKERGFASFHKIPSRNLSLSKDLLTPVLGGGSRKGGRGTCSRCGLKYVRWLDFCRELFQRHGGTHQWLADDARLQHVRRG